jgi:hypothetical protein
MSIFERLSRLPDSGSELAALSAVCAFSGLAALSRLLYGKDDLYWRHTCGSVFVAMCCGIGIYSLMASVSPLGGYTAVSVSIAVGLFTDDFMKRLRKYWAGKVGDPS